MFSYFTFTNKTVPQDYVNIREKISSFSLLYCFSSHTKTKTLSFAETIMLISQAVSDYIIIGKKSCTVGEYCGQ